MRGEQEHHKKRGRAALSAGQRFPGGQLLLQRDSVSIAIETCGKLCDCLPMKTRQSDLRQGWVVQAGSL